LDFIFRILLYKTLFFPEQTAGMMAGEKRFKRSEAADGNSACGLALWERKFTL